MANGNAIVLLEALGLLGEVIDGPVGPVPDACGSMDAESFLGRVLATEVLSVGDPGTETEALVEEGCATMVMCGRPEGYVDTKLAALREVALCPGPQCPGGLGLMAKPHDPHDATWVNIANQTEAKYGKGWDYMSPDQKRGAYCSVFMSQAAGFARMDIEPQTFVDLLVYINSRIIDEVEGI